MAYIKNFLKYSISLGVAIFLLWFVFKDRNLNEIYNRLDELAYQWVILSIAISIFGHIARAYRWNVLMEPMGNFPSTFKTFLAVMVGYLVNLAFPRAGEISRCGVLKKIDNVPMTSSLGTVVAERVIDALTLMGVVLITFIIEFDLLKSFLYALTAETAVHLGDNLFSIMVIAGVLAVVLVTVIIFIRSNKTRLKGNAYFVKVHAFGRELLEALISVKRIKNKSGFWFSTLIMWGIYFLITYLIFFSLPTTSHLSLLAGLSVLAMGGLGMAVPVQGGIGSYHALVSGVLILYGIGEEDSVIIATVIHASQALSMIFFGVLSLVIIAIINHRKSPRDKGKNNVPVQESASVKNKSLK